MSESNQLKPESADTDNKSGNIIQDQPDEPLSILIADDSRTDLLLLRAIVSKEGHEVFTASDGQEAIDLFKAEAPDLVLLDALMPNVDGFEAARTIRALAGENLVPIIFLTSLKDATSLADCLDAGGNDFLTKPYNRIILKAKILSFARMRRLHETVQKQRDEIVQRNERLMHEQEVAKKVFDNIAHPGCIDAPNIKHLLSPMAVFNGDLVLAARKPSGGMYVFLGDFTGHGLPAAIGAMPVSEIFYGMALKGFSMQDILREINKKLKRILPVGVFCCACMADLNFRRESVEFWIGGLPDIFIYRHKTASVEQFGSFNLPLGVISNEQFNSHTKVEPLYPGDRIYMWSDGILEAINDQQQMFGEAGVLDVFANNQQIDAVFDELLVAVDNHTGGQEQDDDYTVVEVTQIDEATLGEYFNERGISHSLGGGPTDWQISFELRPKTLRDFNPLPLITHLLMEVPGLRQHSGQIYTILAELYSNALEHGVLGLDSILKTSAEGFAEYYEQRSQQLDNLEEGWVTFILDHQPSEKGGLLRILVKDSGAGFDWRNKIESAEHKTEGFSGRGMPLIRTLCDSVRYIGEGNQVEVIYNWEAE